MKLLDEDCDERRMFDDEARTSGGPLPVVRLNLIAWARMLPPQGSHAKVLVIMANEIAKAIEALTSAQSRSDPSP